MCTLTRLANLGLRIGKYGNNSPSARMRMCSIPTDGTLLLALGCHLWTLGTFSSLMAQYAAHHRQIWSNNPVNGIAMNWAFHINHCSTFGYNVGWMLAPCLSNPQLDYMWVLACKVYAQPNVYREAIQWWNTSHPNDPFVEASGDMISIEHLDLGGVSLHDLNVTKVIGHLLSNKIPPSWIDHSYTFVLHYLIVFEGPVGLQLLTIFGATATATATATGHNWLQPIATRLQL